MDNNLFNRKTHFNTITTTLLLIVVTIICSRCIKIQSEEIPITLSVSTNSLNFTADGDELTFYINSNDGWYVNNDYYASWLTVSPTDGFSDGNVTVTADANTSSVQRTATITVYSSVNGVPEQTISVTQARFIPNLSVSSTSLSFVAAGEQKSFTVTSNTNWTVSRGTSTWFTLSTASGSGNSTVTVTASANTSTSSRSGTVTVSGGGITRTISVAQSGTANTAQVRFVKSGAYSIYTYMGIADISITTIYASCYFGTGSGTSSYYDVPAGTLTPVVWNVNNSHWDNFVLTSDYTTVWTVNLTAKNRYTIQLYYDTAGYHMQISNDGTYSSMQYNIGSNIPEAMTQATEGRSRLNN